VRPAECGQEVIQRSLVRQIDSCDLETPLVFVAVEQIVMADADVKQVTRSDPGRIVVVILRPRRRDLHKIRTVLRWGASGQRCREGRTLARTEQSSLQLLIPSESGQVYWSGSVACEWNCTRHDSAVVPPIETNPRPTLPRLILKVRRLIEFLVMINSENAAGRGRSFFE
jgi:hypothetical protein